MTNNIQKTTNEFVILVSGSRKSDPNDLELRNNVQSLLSDIAGLMQNVTLVHGGAKGIDTIVGEVAGSMGFNVRVYPANWDLHGSAAGPIRNSQMLQEEDVDFFIGFPGMNSIGTWDMIHKVKNAKIPFVIMSV